MHHHSLDTVLGFSIIYVPGAHILYVLSSICIYAMLIFYHCLPMFHCSNICSLHVFGPVGGVLLFYFCYLKNFFLLTLTHFKLGLVNS